MLNTIFSGLNSTGSFTISSFMICLLAALILGALIAAAHTKTTRTSGSFAITLAILPAIVTVIIMMVNGSIGAGIAVAGAFSLVRFRSVAGTAKEITSIFLAMATGLSCGMGYPAFGALFALILCAMLVFYDRVRFGERNGKDGVRNLIIIMPEDINYTHVFDDILDTYTEKHKLEAVKTTNLGSLNKLTYLVTMKKEADEKKFIDEIRLRNGNLEITLSETLPAQNEL